MGAPDEVLILPANKLASPVSSTCGPYCVHLGRKLAPLAHHVRLQPRPKTSRQLSDLPPCPQVVYGLREVAVRESHPASVHKHRTVLRGIPQSLRDSGRLAGHGAMCHHHKIVARPKLLAIIIPKASIATIKQEDLRAYRSAIPP